MNLELGLLDIINQFFLYLLTNLSTSIQKITEQRKYDRDILSLTAGLLNASNFNTHNLEIGIQSPKAGDTNQRGVLSHIKKKSK